MALLIAPLFTAGIAVGGIQNANAGEAPMEVVSCQFTEGGIAEVTLSLGEESGTINKSVECNEVNNGGGNSVFVANVIPSGVASCTEGVDPSAITPSFGSLIIGFTATWIETITLNSDPGVASFECDIEFDVDTEPQIYIALFQTVTINFVPPNQAIGGTSFPVSTTTLLVAGAQANTGWWIIALVGVVAGVGIAYKAKTNKTDKETL